MGTWLGCLERHWKLKAVRRWVFQACCLLSVDVILDTYLVSVSLHCSLVLDPATSWRSFLASGYTQSFFALWFETYVVPVLQMVAWRILLMPYGYFDG
ncbi:hypothetical protein QBC32DRAFT_335827 [Pseudoneurospora amorphoporcata]|uniref:Uncharacterized protein n=1 Tax=Pseudoneurospora amorphoporcata TaxID=241081 RepID=A0AAN6SIK4_9PEZI|nr:hypothetical protein QBC32DRAFT_335827 [Pseudoneurospora amorphoporcata]